MGGIDRMVARLMGTNQLGLEVDLSCHGMFSRLSIVALVHVAATSCYSDFILSTLQLRKIQLNWKGK